MEFTRKVFKVYDGTIKRVQVRGKPPVTWGNKGGVLKGEKWWKNAQNGVCKGSVEGQG